MQDRLRKKATEPFRLQIGRTQFSKAAMMKGAAGRKPKHCHRFWSTLTAGRGKRNALSCVIWCLLIGEQAIERGMQPKVLRQLLGLASIKTTMDRYVHVTDESLVNAVRQCEAATPTIYEKRA